MARVVADLVPSERGGSKHRRLTETRGRYT